jgi:hypothetical protein
MTIPSALTKENWQHPDSYATSPAPPAMRQRMTSMFTNRLGQDLSGAHFSNETILPAQWQDTTVPRTPAHALLRAVFEDAINTLRKYGNMDNKRALRLYAEAWEWIWEDESNAPLSFGFICQHLKYEPDAIREAIGRQFSSTGQRFPGNDIKLTRLTGPPPVIGSARPYRGHVSQRRVRI